MHVIIDQYIDQRLWAKGQLTLGLCIPKEQYGALLLRHSHPLLLYVQTHQESEDVSSYRFLHTHTETMFAVAASLHRFKNLSLFFILPLVSSPVHSSHPLAHPSETLRKVVSGFMCC